MDNYTEASKVVSILDSLEHTVVVGVFDTYTVLLAVFASDSHSKECVVLVFDTIDDFSIDDVASKSSFLHLIYS